MGKQNTNLLDFSRRLDQPMLLITILLIVIGLIMVFSASYAVSLNEYQNAYHYIIRQASFALGGGGIMLIISGFPYYRYHGLSKLAYGVAVILMIFVTFGGVIGGGAQRWLVIGSISFQPSEVAKLAIIILLASQISKYKKERILQTDPDGLKIRKILGLWQFLWIPLGIVVFTAIFQSHLSATLIILGISVVMLFVGGADFKILFIIALLGIAIGIPLALQVDYISNRVDVWIDPFIDLQGDGWQGAQSFIAIGSGGLFGLGFGESRQKHMFLPEPHNDFIFSVVAEELGFIGAILIILIFAMFIGRGYIIAFRAKDKFGMLLAVGIVTKFAIQVIMNLAVVSGLMPVTGISLPLFSYGGTALILQMVEIGILLNISRFNNK